MRITLFVKTTALLITTTRRVFYPLVNIFLYYLRYKVEVEELLHQFHKICPDFFQRTEKAKKTKFELELVKIVDCFIDGHGNYDSNLVSFKIKSSS